MKAIRKAAFRETAKDLIFRGIPEEVAPEALEGSATPDHICAPRNVPEGGFRSWLETMERGGCKVEYR